MRNEKKNRFNFGKCYRHHKSRTTSGINIIIITIIIIIEFIPASIVVGGDVEKKSFSSQTP